ncbi:MAG: hypothetical protein GY745_01715 [Actinomycetia bacterium]|nr:hypothetical protein [Actinomycetes bacterium]MCP4083767.1 hypothetical protein [Actinomycetes bacterium]
MTPEQAVAATKDQMGALGAGYMLDNPTRELGKENGYRTMEFYFAGRGGVLGECDADVVKSAFGWFEAGMCRSQWEAGCAVAGPKKAAELYNQAMASWGRDRLAGVEGLERFAELGERMVADLGPEGLPLFAGWRAMPRAEDAPAHAYQVAALLRELRGSYHIVAATAQGLSDVETMMANPGQGQARAEAFGHQPPYPDSDADRAAFKAAEETTDQLMTKPWSVLSDAERDEMVELTQRLHDAVG